MPSLGGRVPQALKIWMSTKISSFNALFGRTGPAGPENVFAIGYGRAFQCPLWADGSRRLTRALLTATAACSFNALFGRTGPAGSLYGALGCIVA